MIVHHMCFASFHRPAKLHEYCQYCSENISLVLIPCMKINQHVFQKPISTKHIASLFLAFRPFRFINGSILTTLSCLRIQIVKNSNRNITSSFTIMKLYVEHARNCMIFCPLHVFLFRPF